MRMFLLTLVALLILGCASAPVSWRAEPKTIIVRNRSGTELASVSLNMPEGTDDSALVGVNRVAPVPRDSSQVLARRISPPPLPGVVEVRWRDRQGARYSREVAMEPILETATGEPGEMLVFEIRPAGEVTVYCQAGEGRAY